MNDHRTIIVLAISIVLALLVGGMVIVAYRQPYRSAVSNLATESTTQGRINSSSNISSSGLELLVRLNATRIPSHGAVAARLTLFNSLDKNLTLIPHPANYTFSNCDFREFWGTTGYALFKGHYTSANISSAGEPLRLVPPIGLSCVTWLGPSEFLLLPRSSTVIPSGGWESGQAVANITNTFSTGNGCCTLGPALFGYWDLACCLDFSEATASSTHFHYFPPGSYTLRVDDMWNQTVYAYFEVT